MKSGPGPYVWITVLRTWWLTCATAVGALALVVWAASVASFDPAASVTRHHTTAAASSSPDARADAARASIPSFVAAATDITAPHRERVVESAVDADTVVAGARTSAASNASADAADARDADARDANRAADTPPVPAAASAAPPPSASEPAPVLDPPDSVPDADRPRNEARRLLGGWVFDERGTGVSGIHVVAEPRRMFGEEQSPPGTLRTASDGSGAFAFRQLPDGEYQLRTEPTTDYDSASAVVRAGADAIVLTLKVRGGGSLLVHGVVESSRGAALAAVRVELLGRPGVSTFSDAQGRYALRIDGPKRLQNPSVRFTRKGYRDYSVAIAKDATDLVENARLEPVSDASTLTGSVRGNDGTAVAAATIELYSAELGRSYRAASDRNGAFAIAGIDQAADFRLWVRPASKYRDRTLENVIIGGSLDVIVEAIGSAQINGHFMTADGQPVPAFTMWLTPAYGAARAVAVTSGGDGAFTVRDVPEGPAALSTRAAPMLSVTGIQASAKSSGDLRVPLDVGTYRLEGAILSDDGQPVGGARISLQWSMTGLGLVSSSSRETVTDANGYFLFTQLGAGPHTLAVTATGFRALQRGAAVAAVNAPLALTLQRGH